MKNDKIIDILSGISEKYTDEAADYIGYENSDEHIYSRTDISKGGTAKRFFAVFGSFAAAAALLFLMILPAGKFGEKNPDIINVRSVTPQEHFTYETDENGVVITGYTGNETDIVIPEKINGTQVYSIGNDAFRNLGEKNENDIMDKIKSVVIPIGVTEIQRFAFANSNIESIKLPPTLEKICDGAFSENKSLKLSSLPSSLKYIGNTAFSYCTNIISLEIPENVSFIGDFAFSYCSGLVKITLPDTISEIPQCCFEHCTELREVNIPAAVKQIGEFAFLDCSKLSEIEIPDGIETIGNWAFQGCKSLKRIVLPDNLEKIEVGLLSNCSELTEVILPKNLKSICSTAFMGCIKLEKIVFGDKLEIINDYAFNDCRSLSELNLPDSVKYIYGGNTLNYTAIETFKIPENLTCVGAADYENGIYGMGIWKTGNLKKIIIPKNYSNTKYMIYHNSTHNESIEYEVEEGNEYFVYEDGCLFSKDRKTLYAITKSALTADENGEFFFIIPPEVEHIVPAAPYTIKEKLTIILNENIGDKQAADMWDFMKTYDKILRSSGEEF